MSNCISGAGVYNACAALILMRLAENESRRVGMKFESLVELSRAAEGLITRSLLWGSYP